MVMKGLITIRPATDADITYLYDLRNIPEVHQFFKQPRPVQWEEHRVWFSSVQRKETCKLFIILLDGHRSGQLRFDKMDDGSWEISISIHPDYWGKGIASSVLKNSLRQVQAYTAYIHQKNIASQNLFQKLGFTCKDRTIISGRVFLIYKK